MTTSVQGVRRRRSARQVELLDRLVALMAAEGFAHLTLDDVAERLRCSKSTLYVLASSKQELVVEVVTQYFRISAQAVEARVAAAGDRPLDRVVAYLEAVAERLGLLSRDFLDDLAAFRPGAEVYRRNTALAADRIRDLIVAGIEDGGLRSVHAAFTAEMVAATMFGIQRGEMTSRLGMTDAAAYRELSALVVQLLARED